MAHHAWRSVVIRLVLLLILSATLASCGDPDLPQLVDDDQALRLLQIARGPLTGYFHLQAPQVNVVGAIVTAHLADGDKVSTGVFDDDAANAVQRAAEEMAARYGKQIAEQSFKLSISLLREPKRMWSAGLRERGLGYARGLYAVAVADEGKGYAFSDLEMHVSGLSLKSAAKALARKRGVRMIGKAPKGGKFLAPTESFTEGENNTVVRLYRASTVLPDIDSATIREGCKIGGDYLCALLQDNNKFLYEGNVGRDKYNKNYNLLRHAGTCYSLYQLHLATGVERYREVSDRAWLWLRKQLEFERDGDTIYAYPVENKVIKLGGTGLMLIALAERLTIERNDDDLRLGKNLANHILRSLQEDGSFLSYWPHKGQKAKRRRSIYYPGEAMLGLMRFYAHNPDPRYVECVAKSAQYLIHERWRIIGLELTIPPDAWLMIALDELHRVRPQKDYADYCLKLADGMVNDQFDQEWEIPYPDYRGGYFPYPPAVTPSGARMEGLTSAYLLAQRAGRDATAIKRTIALAARFQVERIIRPEFAHLYPNVERGLGAFRHSPVSNRIRIDYNQHNISGLLVAARILEEQ
ncbi:MAG TPA: hypothetical protein PK961_07455 [bacterium]|nr:hypothetical protein [bacterium]